MQRHRLRFCPHITVLVVGVMLSVVLMSSAEARMIKMLFWYPGEAGSTEEAAPLLDEFFAYLNTKIAPDTVSGKYHNTSEGGASYITKEKPQVAIISYAAWKQHASLLKESSMLLSILPLPHGQKTETYALVGKDDALPPGASLFSSEPMSIAFVRNELFPDCPPTASVRQTPQLLAKLKGIGDGSLNAFAILTPMETDALSRMSAAWAKNLKTIARSRPIPTARVVLLDPQWERSAVFKTALIDSGTDPKAKEILEEMRLKGFSE